MVTTWVLMAVVGFVLVGMILEQLVAGCERPEGGHPDVAASQPSRVDPVGAQVFYVDLGFSYWCLVRPVEGGFVPPTKLDAGRRGKPIARAAGEEGR